MGLAAALNKADGSPSFGSEEVTLQLCLNAAIFCREAGLACQALDVRVSVSCFPAAVVGRELADRKSTRLNSSHLKLSRMPSSA